MRQSPTPAEDRLWTRLPAGWRRQVVKMGFTKNRLSWCYIIDFLNQAGDLAVEIDGGIHKRQRGRDRRRSTRLLGEGIRVIRFPNKRVLNDLDAVLAEIESELLRA